MRPIFSPRARKKNNARAPAERRKKRRLDQGEQMVERQFAEIKNFEIFKITKTGSFADAMSKPCTHFILMNFKSGANIKLLFR